MPTLRLYRENQYQRSNTSVITDITEKQGCDVITTAESVFYPEGGGQPSDTGSVSLNGQVFSVTHASDRGLWSDVWHQTDAPAGTFSVGDEVTLTIDWDRRFMNMQRHLGEHMLSGTMHTLFGGVNKGFHMGDDYISIDIDLGGRMLTAEELELAERTVNDAVWADLPVTVTWFDDYEASRIMPVRKSVPHDGKVSVVTVGDISDPYDCIACCGTHPSSSSEVGLVALYKCDPNKGMNRIFFDCGKSAFNRLSSDSHLLAEISKRYSCSTHDLMNRLDQEAESISTMKARIAALSSYVRDAEKSTILAQISETGSPVFSYTTDILSVDELLKLGFSVISETEGKVLLLLHPQTKTCLLFSSGEVKCGKLVKENAAQFNGRGGGRDDNARAVFTSQHDLKSFANAVSEMI